MIFANSYHFAINLREYLLAFERYILFPRSFVFIASPYILYPTSGIQSPYRSVSFKFEYFFLKAVIAHIRHIELNTFRIKLWRIIFQATSFFFITR